MKLAEIERSILDSFRANDKIPENIEPTDENTLRVAMQTVLCIGNILREEKQRVDHLEKIRKPDGSIVTPLDVRVEEFSKKTISAAFPSANFIGEETDGNLEQAAYNVAVDPIDGSWSFVTHDSTSATSLCVYQNDRIVLGIVMNPSTGEVGYAVNDETTRLVQLSCFGEGDMSRTLPIQNPENCDDRIRINIQPSKGHRKYEDALKDAWDKEEINFVKASGGSPANSLLEAAKGYYIYIHPWELGPSSLFDLGAGIKLVENAGGSVATLDGSRIEPIGHSGLFIAGVNALHHEMVRNILKRTSPG